MKGILSFALFLVVTSVLSSTTHSPAAQPKLSIKPVYNGAALLSWKGPATGFVLEETETLFPALWRTSTEIPTLLYDEFIVSIVVSNTTSRFFRLHLISTNALPPDPEAIAPLPPDGVATLLGDATAFLYTGPDPIQSGVAPGTIDLKRAAVVRGKVQTRGGVELPGVTITILDHPELGSTLSRPDGAFDLAVNGGGLLTVNYEKTGFCPVQRQVQVPWQDYVIVPEVVMIEMDPIVTPIALGANSPFQVAQGSVQVDADGARQATLLFSAGTCANLILANGATQSCSLLNVRATEFTVGAAGPASMPAVLPPASGYTYCVELSADEAAAAGAPMVAFDRPVHFYLENFIGFPVGMSVPTGYYDRQKASWVPSANGRVIKIVSINAGSAGVDTDGDDQVDDGLGLTADERMKLATLYTAGQTLWRVPVTHFTPWDCNWPFGPPDDAISPVEGGAEVTSSDEPLQDAAECDGCVIESENQVLGEAVSIVGTPYSLNYRSDRVPGRDRRLNITLSGSSIPASLKAIRVSISVAGQNHEQTFAPAPGLSLPFVWNGKDAYGRNVQGGQLATVIVNYDYPAVFREPNDFTQAFGLFGGATITGDRFASTITLSQTLNLVLGEGLIDARSLGLGGWTLSVHHFYDPIAKVLHTGNGRRLRGETIGRVVDTFLAPRGTGFPGSIGRALAVGPDGSVYFHSLTGNTLQRIAPDGTETTIAGGGDQGPPFGDGGPAIGANIGFPDEIVLGSDNSIYFVGHAGVVRRIGPDGIIRRVAGRYSEGTGACETGPGADGVPATETDLCVGPIAVDRDGAIYITETSIGNNGFCRIRRVGTDGIITTVAGVGQCCIFEGLCVDEAPAAVSKLQFPMGLGVALDGALYIADGNLIRRVSNDGVMTPIAGDGRNGFSGDGGPARDALFCNNSSMAFAPDGSVYVADRDNKRIRLITPEGIINTIAGAGPLCESFNVPPSGDRAPALQVQFGTPFELALAPDGALLFTALAANGFSIRRLGPPLAGVAASDVAIASEDRSELFVFNTGGRHMRTLHRLTGSTLREFAYDENGRLNQVIEKTGATDKVTTIHHDANGHPTAIVGPYGQVTTLDVDANGFLTRVVNPASETNRFASTSGGLLTNKTESRGHPYSFVYSSEGRLLREEDPGGGAQDFARTFSSTNSLITRTKKLGRVTTFDTSVLTTGVQRRTVTAPDGTQTQLEEHRELGTSRLIAANGITSDIILGPDPRFGMEAPFPAGVSVRLPSALQVTITNVQTAVLSNALDPMSLRTITHSNVVNGRAFITTYAANSNTFTFRTPEGRQTLTTLDALGRIVRQQQAGLDAAQYSYDEHGRLASIIQGTGLLTRTLTIGYNPDGFLGTITDPLGRALSLAYDNAGRLIRATRPDNAIAGFVHDAMGNLIRITPPGRPAHFLHYDAMNQLTNYVPPDVGAGSGPIQFRYNVDGQLTSVGLSSGANVTVNRDATSGRLSSVVLPTGTFTYNHDAATGNITNITAPDGNRLSYVYDGSLPTRIAWAGPISGSVTRTYDNNLRIASESVNGGPAINYQYDRDGLLTNVGGLAIFRHPQHGMKIGTSLGVVSDSSGYDGFAEITNYTVRVNESEVFNATYDHDQVGRITRKSETILGTTKVFEFGFDLAGRLTNVVENGGGAAAYTYDGAGNRLSRTTPGGILTGAYDNQDRLLQYGSATYTHDEIGQVSSKASGGQVTAYTYDKLGNLLSAALPDGTQIEYLIDGRNRRIGKRVNGVLVQRFLYRDALRPSAELDASNQVVSLFIYHGRLLSHVVMGGSTFRIISDYLGSPRLVIDMASGTIVQRMDYDEFGNVTLDTNPGFQPFGYAGGLYDRDTKLVRFGARDYDAETGRWTAREPSGPYQTEDPYTYAANDPVNSIDPLGLDWDEPTIEQPVWDKMPESLESARQRLHDLDQQINNAKPGSVRWNQIRQMREATQNLIKKLERALNRGAQFGRLEAGGLLGRAMCVAGGIDLVAVAVAAVENGHSFSEELDIQDEAERAEQAERGVHTNISCLGPFCIVSQIDAQGNPLQYDPITGDYYPGEL